MASTYHGDGYTIEISREVTRIESAGHHEIAPGWRHVDAHGHVHTSLDTLEWVVTETYWCETCRDEHEEGEYRCRVCGDVAEPRYVFKGPEVGYVSGLTEGRLRMDDGRVFLLEPEDIETEWPPAPMSAWLERVMSREPIEWTVTLGG